MEAIHHQELLINSPDTPYQLFIDRYNTINQLKVSFGKKLDTRTSILIGPTLNVGVASRDPEQSTITEDLMPYWKVDPINSGRTKVRIWPGFSAEIEF